jgi:predicted lysophospholipase L1 biosynthesis ABC-type transport system permease subunit
MAVTSITGIALFTDRLEKALLLESANMLAADRIVSGRGDLPEEVLAEGQARGLETAEIVLLLPWFFRIVAICWSPRKRSRTAIHCVVM